MRSRSGGMLAVFPAGEVFRWRNDFTRVDNPEQSEHVARLAQKTAATKMLKEAVEVITVL